MTATAGSDVVVVGAARTPQGRFLGSLASVPASRLGGVAVRGALRSGGVDPAVVDAVVLGQVLPAGAGQNPTRQAAREAGLGWQVRAVGVNTVCLSGLTAVIEAARAIRLGDADVVVAGGMESMSRAPHLLPGARSGIRYGPSELVDHAAHDGLTDAFDGIPMGALTERDAAAVPRSVQDAVAARSHQRADTARRDGTLSAEIVPVVVRTRDGEEHVARDESVRPGSDVETLGRLRPSFAPDGSITAGNASPLSDGGAAVVLTTRERALVNRWPVMATLRAHAEVAGPDTSLLHQPARAVSTALDRAGWTTADLTALEINEAFAAVVAASAHDLGVDLDDPRLNPHGGAIALGHPLGASGARLVAHAAHHLSRTGGRAAVSLCGGGGQGAALLMEG